jgi:tripartite-type tricarboxylate transporter receptor subunit TctC
MRRRSILFALAASLLACAPLTAQTPDFPNQLVRIIVPFSAGSVTDGLARILADKLPELWGQQVIVDNRPGVPGTASAAKSPADGHTLLLTSNGHALVGSLNKTSSVDPVKDFSGVTQIASVPFVLVAAPDLPVSDLQELLALARAKPGTLNMALPGTGSAATIASELFRREAKIELVAVPYKGAPEAHAGVLRGDAHIFFSAVNIGAELVHTGKVKAIAVSSRMRLPSLLDVPTIAEAGLPAFDYDAWFGVLVPAGTPRPVIEKVNRDIASVLQMPDVRTRLERQGIEPRTATPDRFDAMIRNDTARFGTMIAPDNARSN